MLTHIIARECDLKVKEFIWTGGDCHIYDNHIEAVKELLSRKEFTLPILAITSGKKWNEYNINDFILVNYQHHNSIGMPMAV